MLLALEPKETIVDQEVLAYLDVRGVLGVEEATGRQGWSRGCELGLVACRGYGAIFLGRGAGLSWKLRLLDDKRQGGDDGVGDEDLVGGGGAGRVRWWGYLEGALGESDQDIRGVWVGTCVWRQ